MKIFVACLLFCVYAVNADFDSDIQTLRDSINTSIENCNDYLFTSSQSMREFRSRNINFINTLQELAELECGTDNAEIQQIAADRVQQSQGFDNLYIELSDRMVQDTRKELNAAIDDLVQRNQDCGADADCKRAVAKEANARVIYESTSCVVKAQEIIRVLSSKSAIATNKLADRMISVRC